MSYDHRENPNSRVPRNGERTTSYDRARQRQDQPQNKSYNPYESAMQNGISGIRAKNNSNNPQRSDSTANDTGFSARHNADRIREQRRNDAVQSRTSREGQAARERRRRQDAAAEAPRKKVSYPLSRLWTHPGKVLFGKGKYGRQWRKIWIPRLTILFSILAVAVIGVTVTFTVKNQIAKKQAAEVARQEEAAAAEKLASQRESAISDASILAQSYDYDGAIKLLSDLDDGSEEFSKAISDYETQKEDLVLIDPSEVTHIFYHSLVVEPEKTFAMTDVMSSAFKQWMTTVSEFDKITQKMYDDGYVLIGIYDIVERTENADGSFSYSPKPLYLPKGKKAYIMSLDDLSYYHGYEGRHIATKLIVGDDGLPTCEYTQDDGSIVIGSYDCVPRLNDFMAEHPDGCYKGARGTIALTGYNGILGYRTDIAYKTLENLDWDQEQWLKTQPNFDWDKECAEAKKVADAIKDSGWTFASHTWGHLNVDEADLDRIKRDTEKFESYVKPLIGETEILIFAHGFDIAPAGADGYIGNEKYNYLKSKGFHIFYSVDSYPYTMQFRDEFVHGGRRNLDGYRMWKDAKTGSTWTNDLFDANEILDPARTDMPEL